MNTHIPEATIQRLPGYIRILEFLEEHGYQTVTSKDLERYIEIHPAIIRKDLSCFGEFGVRGKGYNARELKNQLKQIMGIGEDPQETVVIGAGNIGRAIARYGGFHHLNLDIKAIFDINQNLIGTSINQILVYDMRELHNFIKKQNISFVMLCVPNQAASEVAVLISQCQIRGIINFTSEILIVPDTIKVININIDAKIMEMFYYLKSH